MWFWGFILLFVKNGWLILSVCLIIGLIIGIYLAIKLNKRKTIMTNAFSNDERFLNAKTFTSELDIPIMVSDKGYIGIIDHFLSVARIINIKDISGYELQINENRNTFGSMGVVVSALFANFGKVENKVNSIKIIFKMNNFEEPIIEIPFLSSEIDTNSNKYNNIKEEINQFIATLDYLTNHKIEDNNNAG